jgi:hypothetical protein
MKPEDSDRSDLYPFEVNLYILIHFGVQEACMLRGVDYRGAERGHVLLTTIESMCTPHLRTITPKIFFHCLYCRCLPSSIPITLPPLPSQQGAGDGKPLELSPTPSIDEERLLCLVARYSLGRRFKTTWRSIACSSHLGMMD